LVPGSLRNARCALVMRNIRSKISSQRRRHKSQKQQNETSNDIISLWEYLRERCPHGVGCHSFTGSGQNSFALIYVVGIQSIHVRPKRKETKNFHSSNASRVVQTCQKFYCGEFQNTN